MKSIIASLTCFTLSCELFSATYNVNVNTDTGTGVGTTGDLRYCITQSNLSGGTNTITINSGIGTITLAAPLPIINQALPSANVTITALASQTISGAGINRIFIVDAGVANFNNLTLDQGRALGGAGSGSSGGGGGGGAGMGAALFIRNGATANVTDVLFTNHTTIGGTGGNAGSSSAGGGGGGLGGNGGGNATGLTGGGGGGVFGIGLNGFISPGNGGGVTDGGGR